MSTANDPLVDLPRWAQQADPALVVAGNECAGLSPGLAVVAQIATGEIVGANPAACSLIGMTWEDLVGRTTMDPHWGVIARRRHTGRGRAAPSHGGHAHGRGTPRRDARGASPHAGVGGVARGLQHPRARRRGHVRRGRVRWSDVTHTPRGVAATRSVAALYRLLAENVSDVVILSDEHGLIEWVSPSVTAGREVRAREALVESEERFRLAWELGGRRHVPRRP